tara:strand:- start:18292 stop:19734 length:1443 start_codon:yes stop_codon:yes gene_type:complete
MKNKHLLIILFTLLPFITFSQDGTPDLSFGNNGIVETDIDNGWDFAWEIAQQTDGKLLIGGEGEFEGIGYTILARYLVDGSLDTSFGANGMILSDFFGFNMIEFQESNKILTGIHYGGNMGGFELIRFFEDGLLDSSFGTNGEISLTSTTESYKSLQMLNDGNFLISGETTNSPSEIKITRFLQNGDIDNSFGTSGSVTTLIGNENNFAGTMEVTDSNHFFVLCKTTVVESSQYFLLKYLPDGNLDTSFGIDGIADIPGDETSCSFKLTTNGKIVVRCSNEDSKYFLRLLANGMLDTSFGNNGSFNYTFPFNGYLVQENQRIIVYGNGWDPFEGGGYLEMRRYFEGGTIDTGFNFNNNYVELNNSRAIIQYDGKITVVGSSMWYNGGPDFALLRYNNNPLGIEEQQLYKISVYPNPSNGIFNIQHDVLTAETQYQVTDVLGKIITTGYLKNNQTEINLTAVKSGVYFLNASNKTIKLIKN